eukprot:TRINITY_DN195_c0_g2_i1.p1 TRINITY_DN195_c0_g2~~TRINITY_DN195_c0_g2_i1.p1  ORF type:complete len:172 (-),score=13.91 TRINITY_DN195_c0_g2_i1:162-677(-)
MWRGPTSESVEAAHISHRRFADEEAKESMGAQQKEGVIMLGNLMLSTSLNIHANGVRQTQCEALAVSPRRLALPRPAILGALRLAMRLAMLWTLLMATNSKIELRSTVIFIFEDLLNDDMITEVWPPGREFNTSGDRKPFRRSIIRHDYAMAILLGYRSAARHLARGVLCC